MLYTSVKYVMYSLLSNLCPPAMSSSRILCSVEMAPSWILPQPSSSSTSLWFIGPQYL